MKQQKKKKGRSVQELLGIRTFTKYGLSTNKGELLFYLVSPTNISVLSHTNIEIKIRHLMMLLSALPDIEIVCTDSSECFDDTKPLSELGSLDRGRSKHRPRNDPRLLGGPYPLIQTGEVSNAGLYILYDWCLYLQATDRKFSCRPYSKTAEDSGCRRNSCSGGLQYR